MKNALLCGHFSCLSENSHMKKYLASLIVAASTCVAVAQGVPQTTLPRTTLTVGMYQLDTQLALTQEQQMTGLMFRKNMPQQEAMLFVFPAASKQCFWMKNTILPLTAAFVADDGTIVNLEDMKPQTTNSHCSEKPVRFVLEVNQGWFGKRGFKAGSKLSGPPFQSTP